MQIFFHVFETDRASALVPRLPSLLPAQAKRQLYAPRAQGAARLEEQRIYLVALSVEAGCGVQRRKLGVVEGVVRRQTQLHEFSFCERDTGGWRWLVALSAMRPGARRFPS